MNTIYRKWLVFTLLLFLLPKTNGQQICPDLYTEVPVAGSNTVGCYLNGQDDLRSFPDARFICANSTGPQSHLTDIIRLYNTTEPVTKALLTSPRTHPIYIGLTDIASDNIYRWIDDGTLFTSDISAMFLAVPTFDCGYLKDTGALASVTCNTQTTSFSYACGIVEIRDTVFCPTGWVTAGLSCYMFFTGTDARNFGAARAQCQAEDPNADLIILNFYDTNYIRVLNSRPDKTVSYFNGLFYNLTTDQYQWVDGTPFSSGPMNTNANWKNNVPPDLLDASFDPNVTSCVIINNDAGLVKWETADCNTQSNFICELRPGIQCPDNFVEVSDGDGAVIDCYLKETANPLNFQDARFVCSNQTGPNSDYVDLYKLDNEIPEGTAAVLAGDPSIWVDLHSFSKNSQRFVRVSDGSLFTDTNYPILINSGTDLLDCVVNVSPGMARYSPCTIIPQGYACGLSRIQAIENTISCPVGWVVAGDSCYQYFTDTFSLPYEEARGTCKQQYILSDLVKLNIYDVNYVRILRQRSNTDVQYLIGLNDRATEGLYVWSLDDEELPYQGGNFVNLDVNPASNWVNDFKTPTNLTDPNVLMYDCVIINNNTGEVKWLTADCATSYPFICELGREPQFFTSTGETIAAERGFYAARTSAPVDFATARYECQKLNPYADLITLKDDPLSVTLLREFSINGIDGFVGLNDISVEGMLQWASTGNSATFNFIPDPVTNETLDCVSTVDGNLQSVDCTATMNYVCGIVPFIEPTCPDEFVPGITDCYHYSGLTPLTTFADALIFCQGRNAYVAKLNVYDQNYARVLANRPYPLKDYLIGLNGGEDSRLRWRSDDTIPPLTNFQIPIANFAAADCVRLEGDVSNGKWVIVPCMGTYRIICQTDALTDEVTTQDIVTTNNIAEVTTPDNVPDVTTPADVIEVTTPADVIVETTPGDVINLTTPPDMIEITTPLIVEDITTEDMIIIDGLCCPTPDYTLVGDQCHRLYSATTLDFNMATEMCMNDGSSLSKVPAGGATQTYLLEQIVGNSLDNVWIGLSGNGSQAWTWSADGMALAAADSNWGTGQPVTGPQNDCVQFTSNGVWSSILCATTLPYLCSQPAVMCPSLTTETVIEVTFCLVLVDEPMTFVEARDNCMRQGGDLARIDIAEAEGLVYEPSPFSVWFGLKWNETTQAFEWLTPDDNNDVALTAATSNWFPGQPDRSSGEEDCVQILPQSSQWRSDQCNIGYYSLCLLRNIDGRCQGLCVTENPCMGSNVVCAVVNDLAVCNCDAGYGHMNSEFTCVDIDECTAGTDNCGANTICDNVPGTFRCTCLTGFESIGSNVCQDINECTNPNACDTTTETCDNIIGGFDCLCATGFLRVNSVCQDINECTPTNVLCTAANTVCSNLVPGFECVCANGFQLDVNEDCVEVIGPCGGTRNPCDAALETCLVINNIANCICIVGYQKNGQDVCVDSDECTVASSCTGAFEQCVNTPGSFQCDCLSGYERTGQGQTCQDINECTTQTNPCPLANDQCTNLEGTFRCDCLVGFQVDGGSCQDVNECTTLGNPCPANSECTNNVPGGGDLRLYFCTCEMGFSPARPSTVALTGTCSDINECLTNTDDCADFANSECSNTVGGFECICQAGFVEDNLGECVQEDQCGAGIGACGTNEECVADPGSGLMTCQCLDGFTGNPCADINECTQSPSICTDSDPNSECINTVPDFRCDCIAGYAFDFGRGICIINNCGADDVNCIAITEVCEFNGIDSFDCVCSLGYAGNPCADINECLLNSTICDGPEGFVCNNLVGTFECACDTGFFVDVNSQTCIEGCCETGDELIGGVCVYFEINSKTFDDAEAACQSRTNGQIANGIDDQAFMDYFLSRTFSSGAPVSAAWIGLRRATAQNNFRWTRTNDIASPTYFGGSTAGNPAVNGNCVAATHRVVTQYGWLNMDCSVAAFSFCEYTPTSVCQLGRSVQSTQALQVTIRMLDQDFTTDLADQYSMDYVQLELTTCDAMVMALNSINSRTICSVAKFSKGSVVAHIAVIVRADISIAGVDSAIRSAAYSDDNGNTLLATSYDGYIQVDLDDLTVISYTDIYCPSATCQNGGTCSASRNLTAAVCSCPEGFEGSKCEISTNPTAEFSQTTLIVLISVMVAVFAVLFIACCFCFLVMSRNKKAVQKDGIFQYSNSHAEQSLGHQFVPRSLRMVRNKTARTDTSPEEPALMPQVVRNRMQILGSQNPSFQMHERSTSSKSRSHEDDMPAGETDVDDRRLQHIEKVFFNSEVLNARMSSRGTGSTLPGYSKRSLDPVDEQAEFSRPYSIDGSENM